MILSAALWPDVCHWRPKYFVERALLVTYGSGPHVLIQLAREGLARADAHGASPCLASEVLDPAEETERGERGTRNLAPRFLRTEVSPGAAGERKQKLGRNRAGLLIPLGKRIQGTIRKKEKGRPVS